ncbi:hypothetical protein D3C77_591050 [compost metagenome]
MAEIEKENEELIDLVAGMKQDFTSKQLSQQESIVELRQRLLEVEQVSRLLESRFGAMEASATSVTSGVSPASLPLSPIDSTSQMTVSHQSGIDFSAVEHEDDAIEASATADAVASYGHEINQATDSLRDRYPELFDLYARGKSIDMIAKAVGIQRGEVQLILQLANREDA